jgi:hypothetical protein
MKISFALIFSLIFSNSFSQESLVFENLELNENMRLIGMYPHYDEEKTFENYNFIIEDLKVLDSITKIIRKGKEVMNQSTRNEFDIRLFDGDKKIQTWSFNPKYSYIRIDGKSYEFDAKQILDLTEKFGFKYSFSRKSYQKQEEFDKDYENIKSDPNLLFVYNPNFKFAGTFEVKFLKSGKFKHPKAISQYLRKKIGDVKKEDEYRVFYVANEYNRKNPNQYTMTIESDFELFEWFNDKDGEKKGWIPNEYSAAIFVKN